MTKLATYSGIDPMTGKGRTLYVNGDLIQSEEPCDQPELPLLSSGLVDLQVNGYAGHDLNDGVLDPDEVEGLSEALSQVGVSAYLPTLITASEHNLCQRLTAIRTAKQNLQRSRHMIAGIHIEGPSISRKNGPRGAHPANHIRPPSLAEFGRWQDSADGMVRMVTIAPEVEGATSYIREVSGRGVIVALGHSNAGEDQITKAADAGATMSTHLGNGIASVLPRHPNAIWAQLGEDRLGASLILDGHHLTAPTARAMIRAKGVARVILVSDSVKFAGMAAGRYTSPIGGKVEVSESGRVSVADTPYLAGSGASLLDILNGYTRFVGLPFSDAIRMATHNPAKLLNRSGDLKPGNRADFILFDLNAQTGQARARQIVIGGERVLK